MSYEDEWYYADENGNVGPLTLQKLRETLATFPDEHARELLIWHKGMSGWKRVNDIAALNMATASEPPPLPSEVEYQLTSEYPVTTSGPIQPADTGAVSGSEPKPEHHLRPVRRGSQQRDATDSLDLSGCAIVDDFLRRQFKP